ncbi:MAG TPA: hypothetical protein VLB87_05540, partial [Pyrinomonadaceae bacterium]|nr:hypothetical protein [Pyrinomonadaceae bacterium]
AMAAAYEARYGAPAEVIYPMRAVSCPEFDEPPSRLSSQRARNDGPFTIAFAGSINSNGYIQALRALQEALEPVGGRLLIYGPLTTEAAREVGLDRPHTIVRGLLSATELMQRLREEVDALFVPMSFDPVDRTNMELAFPSKLADCTAIGLPLVIYGPEYCSAVRWALENVGVGEVVDTELKPDLKTAIGRLADDPALRVALAKRALEVGRQYFAHEAVQKRFIRTLRA